MTESNHQTRRRYSAEFKQQILAECAQPGASVARVALSHGINANLVHKWRRLAQRSDAPQQLPTFIALDLPTPARIPDADICIELRRGPASVKVTWPLAAAEQCVTLLREVLR